MNKNFKPQKLIYLANAYNAKGIDNPDLASLIRHQRRSLEAYITGAIIKKYDVAVIPPIAVSGSAADICSFDPGFDTWAKNDYTFIYHCDEIWVLISDGWKESYGVQEEIKYANEINKPVKYLNKDTLELCSFPPLSEKEIDDVLKDYNL